MITTDLILIAALLVFLFAWWKRVLRGRTTFGWVLRGMQVVEKIQSLPTEQSSGNAVVNGQLLSNKVVIRRAYRAP